MLTKKCTKCGRELELERFSKNKNSKDGLQHQCKECNRDYQQQNQDCIKEKKHEYYVENSVSIIQKNAQWRIDNPEKWKKQNDAYCSKNKEHIQEYKAEWYQNNKERIISKNSNYYETHKEECRGYNQKYRQSEKGQITSRKKELKYRQREKELPFTLTAEEWKGTFEYFDCSCANCGSKDDIQLDHLIPISSEHCPGTTKFNMIPLCQKCNGASGKWNKEPEDYFEESKFQYIVRYLMSFI